MPSRLSKVIWLRGGFDPAYCKDAQDSLWGIDALLVQPAAQHQDEPFCWSYKVGGEQRFYPTDPTKSNQGAYAELMSDVEPLFRRPPTAPDPSR